MENIQVVTCPICDEKVFVELNTIKPHLREQMIDARYSRYEHRQCGGSNRFIGDHYPRVK